MDKRLMHDPDYYLKMLSAYAADTIEIAGTMGLVKYKVNRYERPMVVESRANNFKVYLSKKTSLSPFTTESNNVDASAEFFARVSIDRENVDIKISLKRWSIIAILFWVILGAVAGFLSGNISVCIFIAIIFIAAGTFLLRGHSKFKALVVSFMNDL